MSRKKAVPKQKCGRSGVGTFEEQKGQGVKRKISTGEIESVAKRLAAERETVISPTANQPASSAPLTMAPPEVNNKSDCGSAGGGPESNNASSPTPSRSGNDTQTLLTALGRVEQTLADRITTLEDTLTGKIKAIVLDEFQTVRTEMEDEMKEIHERITALEQQAREVPIVQPAPAPDTRARNIVLKNLQYSAGEDLPTKVEAVLREGCKLRDIPVRSAVRKPFRDGSFENGVVIAELDSRDHRQTVLRAKVKLRKTRNYRSLYIEPDLDPSTRASAANLRWMLREMGKTEDFMVVGNKVVRRQQRESHQSSNTSGQQRDRSPRDHRSDNGDRVNERRNSNNDRGDHNNQHHNDSSNDRGDRSNERRKSNDSSNRGRGGNTGSNRGRGGSPFESSF